MILRNRVKDPNAVMLIGMAALLLANVLQFAMRWVGDAAENVVLGGMGVLYGIAFGMLLLSARMKGQRRRC